MLHDDDLVWLALLIVTLLICGWLLYERDTLTSLAVTGQWTSTDDDKSSTSLYLFNDGTAVLDGRRGSWKTGAWNDLAIVIDFPTIFTTQSCVLTVENPLRMHSVYGALRCVDDEVNLARVQTLGSVPTALADFTKQREIDSLRQELKQQRRQDELNQAGNDFERFKLRTSYWLKDFFAPWNT
ncbi:MAG: hypothetical protein AAGD01_02220 [Acidobacteriota bacterium]